MRERHVPTHRQIRVAGIGPETHLEHHPRVSEVVVQDLGQLREMPSVPLLHTHGVCVELLVQNVQASDTLDDHGVHLVGREFQFVPRERMRQTQTCRIDLCGDQVRYQRGQVLADRAVHLLGRRVGEDLEGEARQLTDGVSKLGVGDDERRLGLVFELVQQVGKHRRYLAVGQGRGFVEGRDGIFEFLQRPTSAADPCGTVWCFPAPAYRELLELERFHGSLDRVEVLFAVLQQLLVFGFEKRITGAVA